MQRSSEEVTHLERLAAELTRRGLDARAVTRGIRPHVAPSGDPVEAFIGAADSGDAEWAGRDSRELRAGIGGLLANSRIRAALDQAR